jgi:hypothetical protein
MIGIVPHTASVLTQNNIFPHFSDRINAYVIPPLYTNKVSLNDSLKNYIKQEINKTDYVLLDLKGCEMWSVYVMDQLVRDENFGLYAVGDSVVLFKRNHNASAIFVPSMNYETFYGHQDFICTEELVKDETSNSGYVAVARKETNKDAYVYGPYVCLPPGVFNVTFEIKVGDHGDGYIGLLDVSANYGVSLLSRKDIYGFEEIPTGWFNTTLSISLSGLERGAEFRIFSGGETPIYLDRVIIERVSNVSFGDFGTKTYTHKELVIASGYVDNDGFMVHSANMSAPLIWYGPYASLPPGKYEAVFFLKVSSWLQNTSERLLTLDVSSDNGNIKLVERDIYLYDFMVGNETSDWRGFELEFVSESNLENVEFRGKALSGACDIYLSFILLSRSS